MLQHRPLIVVALIAIVAVPLLLPAPAAAATAPVPTLESPAHGMRTFSSRPLFTWTPPDGEWVDCDTLRVGGRSSTDGLGRLEGATEEFTGSNRWQPYYEWDRLAAGRWYWQVECTDYWNDLTGQSETRMLQVLGRFQTPRFAARNTWGRQVRASFSWVSNQRAARVVVVARQPGGKIVGRRAWWVYGMDVEGRNTTHAYMAISRHVRSGTRLYLTSVGTGVGGGRFVRRATMIYR